MKTRKYPEARSVRKWSRQTEGATRNRAPKNLRGASQSYKKLDIGDQWSLVQEIVETRSVELCRAYHNVVDVAAGYQRSRSRTTGKVRIRRIPGIIFVVKRKWNHGESAPDEMLPRYIFAYWKVGGVRKLCAVPTDVEDVARYAGVQPQARRDRIAVMKPHSDLGVWGSVSCAVKRNGDPDVFVLSARHVFSLSKETPTPGISNTEVRYANPTGTIIARGTNIRGPLRSRDQGPSFDAQLARIIDLNGLRNLLNGVQYSATARNVEDIPEEYWIITSRVRKDDINRPVRLPARKRGFLFDFKLDYEQKDVRDTIHTMLIESALLGDDTTEGDSGSPVVSRLTGGMLLGMHIAGGPGVSCMIPAWQLFQSSNYRRSGESWRIHNL